ncbi:TIGR03067 domain-containing protein [Desulfobulbus sp.]|uniref:TIGR03067 domain-containing protein n=1 Tax=Desulfobulbus sp. TaxID=895 RepID=UPI0027B9E7D8|nr:TIGR03067 domain-containing protein [Desulfobulbus sp.]
MRSKIFVFATVMTFLWSASTFAVAQTQEKSTDTELQKFQGTWVMISGEMDGKKVPEEHVKQNKITVVGNKVELFSPHQHKEVIVASITKLDVTKNPKEMHWVRVNGPYAGKTVISIYEFEGPDQYKVSFDPAALTVPKKFGTETGSGHIWHNWKRLK